MNWFRRLIAGFSGTEPSLERGADTADEPPFDPDEVVKVQLNGELDLHHFRAAEVKDLVREYVLACQGEGVLALRLVHGKGKGTLRRTVHGVLDAMPEQVLSYQLAEPMRGGWGATLVTLRAKGHFERNTRSE